MHLIHSYRRFTTTHDVIITGFPVVDVFKCWHDLLFNLVDHPRRKSIHHVLFGFLLEENTHPSFKKIKKALNVHGVDVVIRHGVKAKGQPGAYTNDVDAQSLVTL
jgi:hypothetical protein